ncbi:MAG: exo-alpha-sialidase [Anaerolineae bacterium]|nr:exo-alpha-sialidase [Anaerolineae bacterium]
MESEFPAIDTATAVLALPPVAGNPRNSEGDFVQLADGRWLFVYTHFEGGADDHAAAYLAGRLSEDDGETWTHADHLVLANEGEMNVMSVSLLRLQDGRIALVYLRKNSLSDCQPFIRFSSDEATSWSAPVSVVASGPRGYYVVNNDRVIQLHSGRLIVPTALHPAPRAGAQKSTEAPIYSAYGEITCYLSDDAGATWRAGQQVLVEARPDGQRVMVQEPGMIELKDGRLMMYCRTDAGSQYIAYSRDGGVSWSPLHASEIISPRSPASIARIPATGDLLLVWNNHADAPDSLAGLRTPLTVAISQDEGDTWMHVKNIAVNPHGWYCYTAIAFAGEHILLAHSAGDRRENNGLAKLQITRLPVTWLYEP